jgi:hypothetical protein
MGRVSLKFRIRINDKPSTHMKSGKLHGDYVESGRVIEKWKKQQWRSWGCDEQCFAINRCGAAVRGFLQHDSWPRHSWLALVRLPIEW